MSPEGLFQDRDDPHTKVIRLFTVDPPWTLDQRLTTRAMSRHISNRLGESFPISEVFKQREEFLRVPYELGANCQSVHYTLIGSKSYKLYNLRLE